MTTEQPQNPLQRLISERGLPLLIGLAIVGLIMICVFGVLLLQSLGNGTTADETGGSPTPFAVGSRPVTSQNETLVVGVNESSTVSVTLDSPVSLQLRDRTYGVNTQLIAADGIWSPAGTGAGTAVWVYGTIINYVVGIPDAADNRALLEQLVPGDELILTTRGGTKHIFVFDSRQLLSVNDRDLFAQTMPGITIALLQGSSDERLVVHGTYVVPESTSSSGAGTLFELGETAQLEDVQLTVTGATYLPDRPELPAGFAFFLVDYQAQNIGFSALDTGRLQFRLADEIGNQYAQSGVASQLGNHPPLTGFLNANQLTESTIGFQVPAGLASPTLNLVVGRTGSNSQVMINLPFPGGAQAAQGASVSLQDVIVSPDNTSLILTGQVTNLGEQVVVVSENSVTLKTNDGASYLLLATNPPFPWTVGANQAVTFVLTYQRPLTADAAVFTVLNQPFQLSGLR